jgi:diaminopimelate decarboxylase
MITRLVEDHAQALAGKGELPAFVYDLAALREHAAEVKAALSAPGAPEIFYAAKANPDAPILQTLAPHVDGIEVASGGELAHLREALPDARLAFGGPGKTDDELRLALDLSVERIHVESPYELSRLADIAATSGREVDVLLRLNLAGDRSGVALAMSGPFGMDPDLIESCTDILNNSPQVRLRGIHAHLASGLDASAKGPISGTQYRRTPMEFTGDGCVSAVCAFHEALACQLWRFLLQAGDRPVVETAEQPIHLATILLQATVAHPR